MIYLDNAAASFVVFSAYFSAMASLLPESENSFYKLRMSALCPTPCSKPL